jgi:hypothetical protein
MCRPEKAGNKMSLHGPKGVRKRAVALHRRDATARSSCVITARTTITHGNEDALRCPSCGYEYIWLSGVDKNHEHTGLEFRCEACPSVSVLVFEQHKGQVFLAWY